MIGAIAGDIVGSIREWHNIKSIEFELFEEKCRFTDDTVLTIAVADCVLNGKDYAETIMELRQPISACRVRRIIQEVARRRDCRSIQQLG